MSQGTAHAAPAPDRAPPVDRRIALITPRRAAAEADDRAQHAMRLFDTMLWVLKGTTRDRWATAAPEDADIVVVPRDAAWSEAANWRARGKVVVEIADDGAAGESDLVLSYPFPAKRVLELLERLSNDLEARSPAPTVTHVPKAPPPAATMAPSDRWAFAEALRTVRSVRNDGTWLVARNGTDPVLWVRGDASAYFTTEGFLQTLRSDPSQPSRLELRDGYPPPKARIIERPGAELFWFAGFNASEDLAPWLDARQTYRATAWPDCGRIRPDGAALRVIAHLATQPCDVRTLAERARVPVALASRVINALSLCEVLASGDSSAATTSSEIAMTEPKGGFSGFLRRLRQHLGIGAAA